VDSSVGIIQTRSDRKWRERNSIHARHTAVNLDSSRISLVNGNHWEAHCWRHGVVFA
jgi:hypothetical protein